MRISDWSSDVCSSDLWSILGPDHGRAPRLAQGGVGSIPDGTALASNGIGCGVDGPQGTTASERPGDGPGTADAVLVSATLLKGRSWTDGPADDDQIGRAHV